MEGSFPVPPRAEKTTPIQCSTCTWLNRGVINNAIKAIAMVAKFKTPLLITVVGPVVQSVQNAGKEMVNISCAMIVLEYHAVPYGLRYNPKGNRPSSRGISKTIPQART